LTNLPFQFLNVPTLSVKKVFFVLLGLMGSLQLSAQHIARLRFEDDFAYLKHDSLKKAWDEKWKMISLGDPLKLSIGGEWREQYQSYTHVNFGEVPANYVTDSPHQLLNRLMLHANLQWAQKFRIFAQLNSTIRFWNPNPITSQVDQNELSVHQLFAEASIAPHSILRVGQQEHSFGIERFVATREGPNTRQTFYGATLKYQYQKNKATVFLSNPIKMNVGVWDDVRSSEILGGSYFSHAFKPKLANLDLYYFYFESTLREYMFKKGLEKRHTLGFRLYSDLGKINYDLELANQSGTFQNLDIQAFMGVWDFNVSPLRYAYLGFSGNYVPGDASNTDGELNTFNTLFARPPFGQTVALNISNTLNLSPYLRYQRSNKWIITLRGSFVNRTQTADGIFTPNMSPLRPIVGKKIDSQEKELCQIFALDANFIPTKHWALQMEMGYCSAGDYLKDSGIGKNVIYFAARSSLKF
jgi:hypothetical protein